MNFSIILFENFETLDVFGPVEVIGRLSQHYCMEFYSPGGGIIRSTQGVRVHTLPLEQLDEPGILFIPGGFGIRTEVSNGALVGRLKELAEQAPFVLTVCTGSALLAKTGLLKGLRATSNKLSFAWVTGQANDVIWVRNARWVSDGKYYTSSGVSAGIDMTLGWIADTLGRETARNIAQSIEYIWNEDPNDDPFA
ncbi:MAG: DJ-1/PfpI family protein [Deltaproteobacteria bacterium]